MERAEKKNQPLNTSTEVSVQEKTFLVCGNLKVPVHTTCASKFSLFFRYIEDQNLSDTDEPVNLLIQNNGQSVEIGPCRILPDAGNNGYSGRLVSTHDVYDFQQLLQKKKLVKLQSGFHDLPLLLARKNEIKSEFKDYVADLKYDLQVYKNLFDHIDAKYREEPEEVRNSIQTTIIRAEGPNFRRFLEDKLDELKSIVSDFTLKEHQGHGFYLRNQLWDFILCSPFARRATLKPRGYAGDFKLMQMIYLNNYQGNSTYAKLTHKHGVEQEAAQSVRNRIELIARLLGNYQNNHHLSSGARTKVLSVGCGPAFELQNILKSPGDFTKYHFTLFDQDNAALSEAAKVVKKIGAGFSLTPDVAYIQGSVRTVLFSRKLEQKWGQFHFIYALGLFDYLSSRVAKAVLDRLYRILQPGGELVVGNFNVSNPSRYYMEYWGNWQLIHRSEEDFKSLFQHTSSGKCSVLYDDTGSQMFLHIRKDVRGA